MTAQFQLHYMIIVKNEAILQSFSYFHIKYQYLMIFFPTNHGCCYLKSASTHMQIHMHNKKRCINVIHLGDFHCLNFTKVCK